MALFGNSWKDDMEDDGPMVPSSWKDESEDTFPVPEPDVRLLLDRMTNSERLEIFSHYCLACGRKIQDNCKCSSLKY